MRSLTSGYKNLMLLLFFVLNAFFLTEIYHEDAFRPNAPFQNISPKKEGETQQIQSQRPNESPIVVDQKFQFGADLSSLPQIWDANTSFFNKGVNSSIFQILSSLEMAHARLRLWVDPEAQPEAVDSYCDLNHTLMVAQTLIANGWEYLLDFHYSDWWADPGQQTKPSAWNSLSLTDLTSQLYNYTYQTLQQLEAENSLPSMIQVGNEISHGFLWPEGGTENFTQFSNLLSTAIGAIRQFEQDYNLANPIEIMIHYAPSEHMGGWKGFFDNLIANDVSFDVIGLSYYPMWHGSLDELNSTVTEMISHYEQEICIVETAFPYSSSWNDDHNNVFYMDTGPVNISITPEGQRTFYESVIQIVADLPINKGLGVYLWEPAWVTPCIGGSPMENAGLFDFSNNLLEVYQLPIIDRQDLNSDDQTLTDDTSDDGIRDNDSIDDGDFQIAGYKLWGILVCYIAFTSVQRRKNKTSEK